MISSVRSSSVIVNVCLRGLETTTRLLHILVTAFVNCVFFGLFHSYIVQYSVSVIKLQNFTMNLFHVLTLFQPFEFHCYFISLILALTFTSPQLSLRRQQVSEKLNEWAVFNEKNKELCEWLTQMESKVSQNGDISIEEMIEKLRKVISAHDLNKNEK